MRPSSAAARSLVLALFGMGAASFAAHGQNVTAFNPYSGTGLPGGPIPQYGSQAAYPISTVAPGPTAGPAFNPWTLGGQAAGAGRAPAGAPTAAPAMVTAGPPQAYAPSVQAASKSRVQC